LSQEVLRTANAETASSPLPLRRPPPRWPHNMAAAVVPRSRNHSVSPTSPARLETPEKGQVAGVTANKYSDD